MEMETIKIFGPEASVFEVPRDVFASEVEVVIGVLDEVESLILCVRHDIKDNLWHESLTCSCIYR